MVIRYPAQGGIAGTAIAHLMFDLAPFAIGSTARAGASQWFAEAVATFTLLIAILGGLRCAPQAASAQRGCPPIRSAPRKIPHDCA
jgi:hypothetical protein